MPQNWHTLLVLIAATCRCFTATIEKYVYEVCPFASAAQKDGGMSTSLGSWKGFEGGYRFMVFENGQHCWNGPLRSMRVRSSEPACAWGVLPLVLLHAGHYALEQNL